MTFCDIFFIGFLLTDAMFLGISESSISVNFLFFITGFLVRSTELENTSRDFVSFIGFPDQFFVIFEKQT